MIVPTTIRLTRMGRKKRPFYRIVAADSRMPRDGRIIEKLGGEAAFVCPAFPTNKRTIYKGHLFVGDQLLSDSPMKDHPLTPMRDSNLMRLLAPQVTRPVGLADRLTVARGPEALRAELARLAAEGVAHVVVDAVADAAERGNGKARPAQPVRRQLAITCLLTHLGKLTRQIDDALVDKCRELAP